MKRMSKTPLMLAAWAAVTLTAMAVSAAEPTDQDKADAAANATAKALCDDDWEGGFETITVDRSKYDGQAKSLKDYDRQRPNEPWHALSTQYFGLLDCCGNTYVRRLFGRFHEKKAAETFLKKLYSSSDLARHLTPRFPPTIIAPGARLASDKYTCTLNKENDTLTKASWIVELDGKLYAGGETACKQGRKKKTVTVVDCGGSKTVVTDTLNAPCDTSIRSCLYRLPDEAFAVDHVYTQAGQGTSVAVRAYDLKKKQRVFSADETNDGGPETVLMSVDDIDGDGVPEVVHRVAGTDELVSKLRWRNRRFVKVGK
jgi:hypothetical protein